METESQTNPISKDDYGGSNNRQTVICCLRFILTLQCLGIAGRYLWTNLEFESHIFEYLMFERGVAESLAQWLDDVGAYLCLAAGTVFTYRLPRNGKSPLRWCEFLAAGFVAVWCIADALAHTARGGVYSELTIGEVAVRFACPIALMLLIGFPCKCKRTNGISTTARWILTLALSTTFIVHGYKAIQLHGQFCDLILLSAQRIFEMDLEQSSVESVLVVIGWIDILAAIALIFTRYKIIAVYMLLWGLITSASRLTALGSAAWPETVIRCANWGAVLVLVMMWRWESAEVKAGSSQHNT